MTNTPHIQDEQQRIAELLRSLDAPAPESLHRRIESLVASHQHQFPPRSPGLRLRRLSPLRLASAGALTAAVVAVAIAIRLTGPSSPTVSSSQAAASTLRAATLPAPPESQANHAELAIAERRRDSDMATRRPPVRGIRPRRL